MGRNFKSYIFRFFFLKGVGYTRTRECYYRYTNKKTRRTVVLILPLADFVNTNGFDKFKINSIPPCEFKRACQLVIGQNFFAEHLIKKEGRCSISFRSYISPILSTWKRILFLDSIPVQNLQVVIWNEQ